MAGGKSIKEVIKKDAKGNLIYYKSSYGYEFWKEYDEKGNLIHFRDNRGNES